MKKLYLAMTLVACAWLGCPEKSVETSFRYGMDLEFRGRYEDAETQYLALVRELSESSDTQDIYWRVKALLAAARVEHLYLNDPRRAVARLREALRSAVEQEHIFQAQKEIATIFLDRLTDCRSAAPEIERLVVAFPEREGIDLWRYRLAQCYFNMEQFEQARAEARLLLEKNPDEQLAMEARMLVASSFFVEKKYREALEAHQRILESNPKPHQQARSLFEQGLCYEQLGSLEEAERSFLSALQNHPRPDLVKEKLKVLRRRLLEAPKAEQEKAKTGLAAHAVSGSAPNIPTELKSTNTKPIDTKRKAAVSKNEETRGSEHTKSVSDGKEERAKDTAVGNREGGNGEPSMRSKPPEVKKEENESAPSSNPPKQNGKPQEAEIRKDAP